jgi:hypothetical protein
LIDSDWWANKNGTTAASAAHAARAAGPHAWLGRRASRAEIHKHQFEPRAAPEITAAARIDAKQARNANIGDAAVEGTL